MPDPQRHILVPLSRPDSSSAWCNSAYVIIISGMLHCARRGLSDVFVGLRAANKVTVLGGPEGQSAAADHLRNFQFPCLQTLYHRTQCVYSSSSHQNAASGQNTPMPPWTPTAQLTKRKVLTKRMGFLLQASQDSMPVPTISTYHIVANVFVMKTSCKSICAPQTLEAEQAAAVDKSRKLPEFGPGDVVEIKMVC